MKKENKELKELPYLEIVIEGNVIAIKEPNTHIIELAGKYLDTDEFEFAKVVIKNTILSDNFDLLNDDFYLIPVANVLISELFKEDRNIELVVNGMLEVPPTKEGEPSTFIKVEDEVYDALIKVHKRINRLTIGEKVVYLKYMDRKDILKMKANSNKIESIGEILRSCIVQGEDLNWKETLLCLDIVGSLYVKYTATLKKN